LSWLTTSAPALASVPPPLSRPASSASLQLDPQPSPSSSPPSSSCGSPAEQSDTATVCVQFSTDTISGLALLLFAAGFLCVQTVPLVRS
jgi:hypothetical protein